MTQFDELKARYPNRIPVHELRAAISILELAQYYGFVLKSHKGRGRPVFTHPLYQDTIIIKYPQHPQQQIYQRAGDFSDAGTLIDFVRHRLSTVFAAFCRADSSVFRCITNVLYDYLRIDPDQQSSYSTLTAATSTKALEQVIPISNNFSIDEFDLRPIQEDNYLTRRLITKATLERPEFRGKILTQITYFDPVTKRTQPFTLVNDQPDTYIQFANVAFPYYDGSSPLATGLELRNDTLKLQAPGSDRIKSVFVSNPPPIVEYFVVTESVIDALSHQQLRSGRGDSTFNAIYFATGGQITPQQIHTIIYYLGHFPKARCWELELAFDNDAKGHHYDMVFIQQLTALKFPMTPTRGAHTYYHYLLPQGEGFSHLRQSLSKWVNDWNDTDRQKVATREKIGTHFPIVIDGQPSESRKPDILRIPATSNALRAISEALLTLTGLNQHVRISKAIGKDFNEDLASAS